jgi:cytochrome P450
MMPFGAGHHHCLAEYMLPILQRIIVAVVFHQVKFVPIGENHPMHVTLLPVANPGSFSLTVEENYLL